MFRFLVYCVCMAKMANKATSSNPNPRDVLIHIHEYLLGKGFFYTRQMVANFFLALRSKPFVILAGPSGMGKTQLVRLFAEAIGYRANTLMIPVRPDWTDSSDLLGYVDLKGNFRVQPLLRWVLKAHQHPDELFFVVLDEMNLARVEHYFSEILSIMETRERVGERIQTDPLVSPALLAQATDAGEIAQLGLPDNLYLVGTVNMDETTHPFSRKVLDRAQTLEMNEVQLDWSSLGDPIEPMLGVTHAFLQAPYVHVRDLSPEGRKSLSQPLAWLQKLHQLLSGYGLPIGYRLRDEWAFYMLNRMEIRELVAEGEAMDFLLMQKVLPRIQGHTSEVFELTEKLIRFLLPAAFERKSLEEVSEQLTAPLQHSLPFPRSLQKLWAMRRQYDQTGFLSFW